MYKTSKEDGCADKSGKFSNWWPCKNRHLENKTEPKAGFHLENTYNMGCAWTLYALIGYRASYNGESNWKSYSYKIGTPPQRASFSATWWNSNNYLPGNCEANQLSQTLALNRERKICCWEFGMMNWPYIVAQNHITYVASRKLHAKK